MRGPSYTGRTLGGRYAVEELLGEGGWGAVYAATQTDLGRKVALKILHVDVAITQEAVSRFEREAKAAAAFGHPNIVQVTDFQSNPPNEPPFLVMERLTGQTLGAILQRQVVLPQQRVAAIAYQMLSALDVAHRAGLVHRDVKPDNVFLVSMPGIDDFVKLLDFGIAKLSAENVAQLTGDGQMLGSPAFMSPEQVRSQAIDHRADIYSVGATMYFALAGRLPFDATNIAQLLAAIMEQKPKPLSVVAPNVDPRLAVIVERALHKDPHGRFASAADMRGALEPFVQAGSVVGITPATLESVPNHLAVVPTPKGMVTTGGPPLSSLVTSARPPSHEPQSAMAATGLMGTPMPAGSGPPIGSPPPGTPPPGFGASPPMGTPPPGMMMAGPTMSSPHGAPLGPPAAAGYSAVGPNPYGPTPSPASAASSSSQKSSGLMIGIMIAILAFVVIGVLGGIGAVFYFAKKDPAAIAAAGSASGAPVVVSSAATASPTGTTTAVASGAATPGAVKTKPNGPPGPTPTAPSVDGGGGGQNKVTTVDAGATRPQMAGSTVKISGGSFEKYDIEKAKASVGVVQPQLNACYAATEFDPPNHEFTCWTLTINPSGIVTNARRSTDYEPHAKLDPCVIGAFRMSKWEALPGGGTPQVCLSARRRDNP